MARLEVVGPLAPHVEGYREAMRQRGHTPGSIKNLAQVFAKGPRGNNQRVWWWAGSLVGWS